MSKLSYNAFKTILFLVLVSAVIFFMSALGIKIHKNSVEDGVSETICRSKEYPVVIIDPGHGGEDGGAEANGALEKELNLAISNDLHSLFGMSHYESVMTRTDDRLLYSAGQENNKKRHDLLNRINFANEYDNALFVSIHQNKFEIPKYKGLQVYYSANNPDSEVIAKLIQSNARKYLDNENKREVKQADFRIRVLHTLKMPAVLAECGFLSNPEESELLKSKDYQNKTAFVIFLSLVEYLENYGEKQ